MRGGELSPGEVNALLAYEWTRAAPPDAAQLASAGRNTGRLLALMLGFEEICAAGTPSEFTGDLAPLAARVDWLLQWVLADREADPDWRQMPRPVVLTPETAQWLESSASAAGDWGVLRLYPEPRLPRSLALWAEVEAVTPEPDGWRIRARWQGQNAQTRESLERLLFRLHRQEVARVRQCR
jgi:hypothetical protein